jgi:integrase/recombinase XerD
MQEKNKLSTHIVGFKVHLERLGYSKNMINQLPNHIKEFLEFSKKSIEEIRTKDILNYHQYLQERPNKRTAGGLSESYINHHIYALKLFFGWQLNTGVLSECPISNLEFKAPVSKPREILTQEEIKLLFEVCKTLKERAVLALFYGCGIRRSEGEKLNLKDIHFRSNILYVREGKGNKRRAVPLSPQVKIELWNYATKERIAIENETAFITNRIQKRATGSSYNKILKTILERTGIKKEITLHCLRHSIATHLLESGLSVEYVRDFLGHKHLESTQIYTRVKSKQLWNLNSI